MIDPRSSVLITVDELETQILGKAPLYVGSWSAWTGDPSRPVAQGPERG